MNRGKWKCNQDVRVNRSVEITSYLLIMLKIWIWMKETEKQKKEKEDKRKIRSYKLMKENRKKNTKRFCEKKNREAKWNRE